MKEVQQEAEEATFEAQAGGGLVSVVVTGKMQVVSINISDSAFEEKEMLEDLITAAINNGMKIAQENMQHKMSELTAGLPIPPGMLGL